MIAARFFVSPEIYPFIVQCTERLYNDDEGDDNMDAVSYSNFRQNLKSFMKQVNNDADAVIVTAKEPEDNVVVMSQRDYDAMQETLRIMSNKYLMAKINEGDRQFKAGKGIIHDLIELDDD